MAVGFDPNTLASGRHDGLSGTSTSSTPSTVSTPLRFRQIQPWIIIPLKFRDLRLRGFGPVLALSPSERRQAMFVASGLIRKVPRRSTMDCQLLKTTDELGVSVASPRDSVGDEELVAAARGGDDLAFETIVKRHRQRIFGLALRYTRSREDAEDMQTFWRSHPHDGNFKCSGIQLRVNTELSHSIHEGRSVDTEANCSAIRATNAALARGECLYDFLALLPCILRGARAEVTS